MYEALFNRQYEERERRRSVIKVSILHTFLIAQSEQRQLSLSFRWIHKSCYISVCSTSYANCTVKTYFLYTHPKKVRQNLSLWLILHLMTSFLSKYAWQTNLFLADLKTIKRHICNSAISQQPSLTFDHNVQCTLRHQDDSCSYYCHHPLAAAHLRQVTHSSVCDIGFSVAYHSGAGDHCWHKSAAAEEVRSRCDKSEQKKNWKKVKSDRIHSMCRLQEAMENLFIFFLRFYYTMMKRDVTLRRVREIRLCWYLIGKLFRAIHCIFE